MLSREEKAKFRLETIRKQRIPSKLNAIKLDEYSESCFRYMFLWGVLLLSNTNNTKTFGDVIR